MTVSDPEERGPDQIEAEIAASREQLAADVTALQAKLDVKQQAKHKAAGMRNRLLTADGRPRPEVVAAAVLVLAVVVVRRRLRRR